MGYLILICVAVVGFVASLLSMISAWGGGKWIHPVPGTIVPTAIAAVILYFTGMIP